MYSPINPSIDRSINQSTLHPPTGIQVTRRGGHQRPSLLFDQKQAADIDTHAVHAMAVEGLEALLAEGADPRLGRYREVRVAWWSGACGGFGSGVSGRMQAG
jgi:hypothetical protein